MVDTIQLEEEASELLNKSGVCWSEHDFHGAARALPRLPRRPNQRPGQPNQSSVPLRRSDAVFERLMRAHVAEKNRVLSHRLYATLYRQKGAAVERHQALLVA